MGDRAQPRAANHQGAPYVMKRRNCTVLSGFFVETTKSQAHRHKRQSLSLLVAMTYHRMRHAGKWRYAKAHFQPPPARVGMAPYLHLSRKHSPPWEEWYLQTRGQRSCSMRASFIGGTS